MSLKHALVIFTLTTTILCDSRSRFGEIFGATTLGTAVGSTVGTALGNTLSAPRSPRSVREVVVQEVHHVPARMPARRICQLERTERRLRNELEELRNQRNSLERRLKSLEQELNETEAAIDIHVQTLQNIESKKKQGNIRNEIAEIDVV